MASEENKRSRPAPSLAPRRGLQLMLAVLVAMALLAIYSNVQKARLHRIETVTIAPAPPLPSPTASITPDEP